MFKFSRICDFGTFYRVYNNCIRELSISMLGIALIIGIFARFLNSRIIDLDARYSAHNKNFREIFEFANWSSSQNSRKFKTSRILLDIQ